MGAPRCPLFKDQDFPVRIAIPYEGTTLPGSVFRSGAADEPLRTLIYDNGSDGSVVGAWVRGIADALDRAWNATTFDEQFWLGQSARLVEALTCPKDLVTFTGAGGADGHCTTAATGLRGERLFDWLDEQVP